MRPRFDETKQGAIIDHVFELAAGPSRPPRACDTDALVEKGKDRFASGQYAAALALFEQAYACRPDPEFAEKSFVAACDLTSAGACQITGRRQKVELLDEPPAIVLGDDEDSPAERRQIAGPAAPR